MPSGEEHAVPDPEVQLSLRLSRDPESVARARNVAGSVLRGLGVTGPCIDDVRLVISEACTNAVNYADPAADYRMRLSVKGRHCLIEVLDSGRGFDPAALPQAMPSADAPSGRGVALMRYLSDDLEYRSNPAGGTAVRMEMQLSMEGEAAPSGPRLGPVVDWQAGEADPDGHGQGDATPARSTAGTGQGHDSKPPNPPR